MQRFDDYLTAHRDRFIDDLKTLCRAAQRGRHRPGHGRDGRIWCASI